MIRQNFSVWNPASINDNRRTNKLVPWASGPLMGLNEEQRTVYTTLLRNVYNVWLFVSDSELVESDPAPKIS